MKNRSLPYKSGKSESCLGFDDNCLYISTQQIHTNFEELKNLALGFRKTNTNGYWVVDLSAISEIRFHEITPAFNIRYRSDKNKLKKFWFHITDTSVRTSFCTMLALTCNLRYRYEKENRFSNIGVDLLKSGMAAFFTWTAFYLAQNGSNSHKALLNSMAQLLQSIGPAPVLAIGTGGCGFFIFLLFKHLAQGGKTIQYTIL